MAACRASHDGSATSTAVINRAARKLLQQTTDPLSAAVNAANQFGSAVSQAFAPATAAAAQTATTATSAIAAPTQAVQKVAADAADTVFGVSLPGVVINPAGAGEGKTGPYKSPPVEVTGSPVAGPKGFVMVVLGDSISDQGR